LRVHDEVDDRPVTYSYSVWCTGERELYDLNKDPHQVDNLLAPLNDVAPFADFDARSPETGKHVLSTDLQKTLHRLDALTLVLKTCVGDVCHQPYKALFPSFEVTGGEIYSLNQALDQRFDDYFETLPKVHFSECALGYQSRLEKPEWHPRLSYADAGRPAGGGSTGFIVQGF